MLSFLVKKKSEIHGIGIFTTKPIMKGVSFYKIPMNIISEVPKLHWACLEGKWVSDEKVLNFVNHSCDSNSQILNHKLIAIKDIEKDEEITTNYNETELNGFKIHCNCRSKNCKGYFLRIE
jgi:SET domain-containing protein